MFNIFRAFDCQDCCYGDPAHTWIPVNCEHPVVSAHSDVTRALIKSELAKLQWMLKSAEALGHEDLLLECWEKILLLPYLVCWLRGCTCAIWIFEIVWVYYICIMYFVSDIESGLAQLVGLYGVYNAIENAKVHTGSFSCRYFYFDLLVFWPPRNGATLLRKSEQGNFADLLLKMAELTLRLFDVARCYELLQRAKPLVGGHSRNAVLRGLMDNCMMCECLKTTPSLTGDILPGNDATKTLGELGRLLTNLGYNMTNVTQLTGAESLIDFSNDDLLHTFSQRLAVDVGKGEAGSDLTYLISLFLLRMHEWLDDLSVLVGVDCCKILLQLQIVTAVRDGCLLSIEDAIAALTEQSSVKASCFSNVRLWPLQNLIIATDAQTWPYDGFEPVMYLSDDSLALLDASPEVAGLNLLDMCCGSGVQGISAMAKKAASVTFSDVNPRALRFVRVNLAINGLLSDSCHFYLGNAFSSLRDGDEHGDGGHKFDAILANPPFLPNPDGIASQAIALYGNGGAFGEDVLSSIVEGCCHWLVDGGWLLMVTYAPNVRQMPQRLQEPLGSDSVMSNVSVRCQAKDARRLDLVVFKARISSRGPARKIHKEMIVAVICCDVMYADTWHHLTLFALPVPSQCPARAFLTPQVSSKWNCSCLCGSWQRKECHGLYSCCKRSWSVFLSQGPEGEWRRNSCRNLGLHPFTEWQTRGWMQLGSSRRTLCRSKLSARVWQIDTKHLKILDRL